MPPELHHRLDDNPKTGFSKSQKTQILQELETILDSAAFRGSKRGQQFLRYTVEQTLAGRSDLLKERSIGFELFGRPPSYDTGDDAIVRVAAKEVRTRLNQHYTSLSAPPAVRLELAPGSYVPDFQWTGASVAELHQPQTQAPARRTWRRYAAAAIALSAAGLLVWFLLVSPARGKADMLARFWAPFLNNPRPVLICMANPVVYALDDEVARRFGTTGRSDSSLRVIAVPPNGVVHGREIIPLVNDYVGVGDCTAATRLTALFERLGKATQVRVSNDLSFTDLRDSPPVLIGAFTNAWTLDMMKEWPFVFDLPGGYLIRERASPTNAWRAAGLVERNVTEDHALISRVFDPRSGQPLVTVAGITHFGTAAAAEFLSNASLLGTALRDAPGDWDRKNLQIVIRTSVIQRTPGSPQPVATRFWGSPASARR